MANTYVDYTAVASQTDYNFSFEYLRDDHVKVKVNDVIVTNYTIVTSPTPTKIRFNTAPSAGAEIRIYRDSRGDFSPLVDFVDGSVLTENELDEAYKHNLFVSQEASEGTGNELLNKKGGANYDAEGNKIINLGSPTADGDAANKAYVDQTIDNAELVGGSPATVSLGAYDVTAFDSTEARTLANRFADVVNVKDFGAAGNGSTDDTTAIQAAIDYAYTNKKGTVFFPAGVYVSQQLTLKSYVVLQGTVQSDGWAALTAYDFASVIKLKDSTNDDLILVEGGAKNWGLKDLVIDGNQANNTRGHTLAHYNTGSSKASGGLIDGCKFVEAQDWAIYLVNAHPLNISNNTITNGLFLSNFSDTLVSNNSIDSRNNEHPSLWLANGNANVYSDNFIWRQEASSSSNRQTEIVTLNTSTNRLIFSSGTTADWYDGQPVEFKAGTNLPPMSLVGGGIPKGYETFLVKKVDGSTTEIELYYRDISNSNARVLFNGAGSGTLSISSGSNSIIHAESGSRNRFLGNRVAGSPESASYLYALDGSQYSNNQHWGLNYNEQSNVPALKVVGCEKSIFSSNVMGEYPDSGEIVYANQIEAGLDYEIVSTGNTDFTLIGAGSAVTAGSFVIGQVYTIISTGGGTTDFTLIGATNNNIGTTFTATDVGSGTGTAGEFAVGTTFTATGAGTGTGTAKDINDDIDYSILIEDWVDIVATQTRVKRSKLNIIADNVYQEISPESTTRFVKDDSAAVYTDRNIISGLGNLDTLNRTKRIESSTYYSEPDRFYLSAETIPYIVTAGSFVVGIAYTIVSAGTTDFTLIGAADNNPGTTFTATGAGDSLETGTASTLIVPDNSTTILNWQASGSLGNPAGLTVGASTTLTNTKESVIDINGQIGFSSRPAGDFYVLVFVRVTDGNGTLAHRFYEEFYTSTNSPSISTIPFKLRRTIETTDAQVLVQVYQNSGSPMTINNGTDYTWMTVSKVADYLP